MFNLVIWGGKKEMKCKSAYVFLMTLVLVTGFIASGVRINKSDEKPTIAPLFLDANDADLPIWNLGDSWVYDCDVAGRHASDLSFDLSINNMEMKVEEVLSESYKLSVTVATGDVSGSGSVSLPGLTISGSLINTGIDGFMFVNKSDLGIISSDVNIDAYVDKIVDIHVIVDMSTLFYNFNFNTTNFSTLKFPMNVGDTWTRPLAYIVSEMDVNLLPDPSYLYFMVEDQSFSCSEWDTVDVGGTDYDALKISRGGDDYQWYSPRAGNFVKVDYSNINIGFDYQLDEFKMNLKSTTYSVQTSSPNTPSTPSGDTVFDVGSSGDYTTSTTDPDGEKIRYIFDWGDGTKTTSDFYASGDTATVNKEWTKKGNFTVKVKARDKFGGESSWSDSIQVEVLNDAPLKPSTPSGPASGKIKKSYDYSTSTTDPNGHTIRYGWDWDGDKSVDDWTDYKSSGATQTTSYTWYSQGDYNIHVIAEDEYGEQSEWSDPLPITMPKAKFSFFGRFGGNFPFLEKLFSLFSLKILK